MHIIFRFSLILTFLISITIIAQNSSQSKSDSLIYGVSSSINSTQAEQGDVNFSDGTNTLIRITDEGSFGVIELKTGVPSTTTDKLYNDGGTLMFNGSSLGGGSGATSINGLSDAKYDGSSLFIGNGAGGTTDDGLNLNTAFGKDALNSNTSGSHNTANGYSALYSNTTGYGNTANGYSVLYSNTTGNYNTANGYEALYSNTTGNESTANGYFALYSNTTGIQNTANGSLALYSNTTGSHNSANGNYALFSNSTGIQNTASGSQVLRYNTTGSDNTANGNSALYYNTTGSDNTANGSLALYSNTNGHSNTANGTQALYSNTTGYSNTANGRYALYSNTTGERNTANGNSALRSNTTGNYNTAIGYFANYYNQEGSSNTMIGYQAGMGSTTHNKSGNVFLGYKAGYFEETDNKLYINNDDDSSPLIWGDFTDLSEKVKINGDFEVSGTVALGSNTTANGTNSVAIGNYASTNNLSGSMILADNSTTTVLNSSSIDRMTMRFDKGYRLYSNAAADVGVYMNAGGNSWLQTSDSTKKENFQSVDGEELLNKISHFKLASWNYKTQDPTKFRHYGPMAQDFYSAFGNDGIGVIGNDTTIASADFDGINLIAIQALEKRTKFQDERIKSLEKENEELKKQFVKNESLEKKVEILEFALNKLIMEQPQLKISKK